MYSKNKKTRKQKIVYLMVLAALVLDLVAPAIFYPQKAQAQVQVSDKGVLAKAAEGVTKTVEHIRETVRGFLEVLDWWETDKIRKSAAAIAFKQALHHLLHDFAYDTATWLAAGGKGQTPMHYTESWGEYLLNLADGAAGEFADTLFSGRPLTYEDKRKYLWRQGYSDEVWGMSDAQIDRFLLEDELKKKGYTAQDLKGMSDDQLRRLARDQGISPATLGRTGGIWPGLDICEPSFDIKLTLGLGLTRTRRLEARCTFSEILNNWQREIYDKDFLDHFHVAFDPWENDIGIAFLAFNKKYEYVAEKVAAGTKDREEGQGIKGVVSGITNKILTPALYTSDQAREALRQGTVAETVYTSDIIADAINTFLSTLAGKLLTRWFKEGLASLRGDKKGGSSAKDYWGQRDLYAGQSGSSLYSPKKAAEARYADFLAPTFRVGGPYQILQKLVVCPNSQNPGPDDCVIDQKFRLAIEKQMTIREALAKGNLDGQAPFGFMAQGFQPPYNEGYPYRSLIILRKYRIIPVGWEIAAQYINQYGDRNYNLNELVAKFDAPLYDSTGNLINPFYGLIDPNWVLKAPENFCERKGHGPINSTNVIAGIDLNKDGDYEDEGESPSVRTVDRISDYCADSKSCILENNDGSCKYYGYCTEEKREWNFNGDACDKNYNTCQTFRSRQGELATYLENSLDFNNCSLDNVGCQWRCQDYNFVNNIWTCTEEGEKVLKPCVNTAGCDLLATCNILENQNSCQAPNGVTLTLTTPCIAGSQGWQPANRSCLISAGCKIPYQGVQCTVPGCPSYQNLIPNAGFESGPGNASEIALGWDKSLWSNNTFLRVSGAMEKIYSGSWAIKFYDAGHYSSSAIHLSPTKLISVAPNTNYTLAGAIYNQLNSGRAYLQVLNANGESLGYSADITVRKYSWQKVAFDFTTLALDKVVDVWLIVDKASSSDPYRPNGTVWFDDLTLTEKCLLSPVTLVLTGAMDKDESKIYLDRDAESCDAAADGCHQFISLKPDLGVNLLDNASFENWPNPNDLPLGWAKGETWVAQNKFEKVLDGVDGQSALKLTNDTTLGACRDFDSEPILGVKPNTIYRVSFWAKTDNPNPKNDWQLELISKGTAFHSDALKINGQKEIPLTTNWQRFVFEPIVTNAEDNIFKLSFNNCGKNIGTPLYLDGVQIEEGINFSNFKNYGQVGSTYLKKAPNYLGCLGNPQTDPGQCNNYALYCSADEVGCQLYRPANGDPPVPGIISQKDFCPAECVGYQALRQSATYFEKEVFPQFFIPQTAKTCSAALVGCDEFTNLDEVARGGEGREYYTYLRNCQKPDNSCANFYTWLGSDQTGYQLKVYNLVVDSNNEPDEVLSPANLGPCGSAADAINNPYCKEFYATDGTVSYHIYQNTISCSDNCHPYRKTFSDQMSCQDSGGRWEISLGGCIYDAIPGEGISCPAEAAGCREYKGNAGANVYNVFFDNFEDGETLGWREGLISSDASNVSGHSLKTQNLPPKLIGTFWADLGSDCSDSLPACTSAVTANCWDASTKTCIAEYLNQTCRVSENQRYCGLMNNSLVAGRSYLISFWAKAAGGLGVIDAYLQKSGVSPPNDKLLIISNLPISPEWNYYQIGPFVYGQNFSHPSIRFKIESLDISKVPSREIYLDNILIKEVRQYNYLIKDSWQTPQSCDTNPYVDPPIPAPQFMLGCQQYFDLLGQNHYLKSFTRLCRESAVGCQVFIDTYNSFSPYQEQFNLGDNLAQITVPADKLVYLVDNSEFYCNPAAKGCIKLGAPTLNAQTGKLISYQDAYLISDPDKYNTILCGSPEVGCEEYTTASGFRYFKDPADKVCQYQQILGQTNFGWYKLNSNLALPDCPVTPSQLGILHPTDSWVGLCPEEQSGCTEYIDPLSDISKNLVYNSGFEQDVDNNDIPDYWSCFSGDCKAVGTNGGFPPNNYPNTEGVQSSKAVKLTENNVPLIVEGREEYYHSAAFKQTFFLLPNRLYTISMLVKKVSTAVTQPAALTIMGSANFISPDNSMELGERFSVQLFLKADEVSDKTYTRITGRFYSGDNQEVELAIGTWDDIGYWFDNIELKETGVYYYLEEAANLSACNGLVKPEEGCVLFNDRGNINYKIGERDYSYLSFNADWSPTDAGLPSTDCNSLGCNADEVIKVTPDRTCGEWLTCLSQVKNIDENGKESNYCLELGTCNSFDEKGNCNNIISPPVIPLNPNTLNQTVFLPYANLISDLSGYSKVGLDWSGGEKIDGFYQYSLMPQVGELSNLPNGNFEDYEKDSKKPKGWLAKGSWKPEYFRVVTDYKMAQQKEGITLKEGKSVLKLNTIYSAESEPFDAFPNTEYMLSALVNTLNLRPPGSKAVIEVLSNGTTAISPAISVNSSLDWQKETVKIKTLADTTTLTVRVYNFYDLPTNPIHVTLPDGRRCDNTDNDNQCDLQGSAYFDEIQLRPALAVQDLGAGNLNYVASSCRLYPESNSLSCSYFDDNGIYHQGWLGYCLEKDSINPDICLQWLPIDLIKGDSLEFLPSYKDRMPLYYCMQLRTKEFEVRSERMDILTTGAGPKECNDWFDPCPVGSKDKCCQTTFRRDFPANNIEKSIKPSVVCFYGYKVVDLGDHSWPSLNFISGTVDSSGPDWWCQSSWQVSNSARDGNWFRVLLNFDTNGFFKSYTFEGMDDEGDTGDFSIDRVAFRSYYCSVVARVVTSTGKNRAWYSRVQPGSHYLVPDLYYEYNNGITKDNYPPFGSAVPPEPIDDPTTWSSKIDTAWPLLYEPPNYSYDDPYQVRAGVPYSCYAANAGECQAGDLFNLYPRLAISPTGDLTNAIDRLKRLFAKSYGLYDWAWGPTATPPTGNYQPLAGCIAGTVPLGSSCNSNIDCGSGGICASWDVPSTPCANNQRQIAVCVGDTTPAPNNNNSKPCTVNAACGTGTCQYPSPNDYCGVAPKISKFNITPTKIADHGSVKLEFNVTVDSEQLPITAYRIDWGDGSEISVSGVTLRDRSNPDSPYILNHAYNYYTLLAKNQEKYCFGTKRKCNSWKDCSSPPPPNDDSSCSERNNRIYCFGDKPGALPLELQPEPDGKQALTAGQCAVRPEIQVIDNWGWCNGNLNIYTGIPFVADAYGYFSNACNTNLDAWTKFQNRSDDPPYIPAYIVVSKGY